MDPGAESIMSQFTKRLAQDGTTKVPLVAPTPLPPAKKIQSIVDDLALQQVQQLRLMHIGFGIVSCGMALFVIIRICRDNWRAKQMSVQRSPRRLAFLFDFHPAEIFALIVGCIFFFNELGFITMQAFALRSVFVPQCKASSILVFTLTSMVGWFSLVFGIDMTIRVLKPQLVAPRSRQRSTVICSIIGTALTAGTALSSKIAPPGERCYGDIIFRSLNSATVGIFLAGIMIPALLILALTIGISLYRTVLMDPSERIAGTRMVYYLVLTSCIYMFLLPFWIEVHLGKFTNSMTAARIAEFVLFSSGTFLSLCHFFLRANAVRTAIKPRGMPWMAETRKRRFRLFGPSDLELLNVRTPVMDKEKQVEVQYKDLDKISPWTGSSNADSASMMKVGLFASPLTSPRQIETRDSMAIMSSLPSGISGSTFASPGAGPGPTVPSYAATTRNQKAQLQQEGAAIDRKLSYSLFPGEEQLRLPDTVYSPDRKVSSARPMDMRGRDTTTATPANGASNLPRPQWKPGHMRATSADSSATVQIGLRLSSNPPMTWTQARLPQTHRPSLQAIVQNVKKCANTDKPLPIIFTSPFSPKPHMRSFSVGSPSQRAAQTSPPDYRSQRFADEQETDDYAWLNLEAARASPVSTSSTSSMGQTRTHLARKGSQKQLADANREEIARLESAGVNSGSVVKLRPAYPKLSTPDGGSQERLLPLIFEN